MRCSQCAGIEEQFGEKLAFRELQKYRKKGADKSTAILLATLRQRGAAGNTLLDIGGGVGVIGYELLASGLKEATLVEASSAYLRAAREEAGRRGTEERMIFYHGDFVELSAKLPPADIVTLDRVICCYPEMAAQVRLSVGKARKLYALVYPREAFWMKAVVAIQNAFFRLKGSSFRIFLHPEDEIDSAVQKEGWLRDFYHRTFIWQIVVYVKKAVAA